MKVPAPPGILRDLRDLLGVYRGERVPPACGDAGERPRVGVVLGAQVLPGGRPSRTLEARVRHAARLYEEGELDLLIPTGGLGEHPPSEAEIMARILRDCGVPDEALLLEDRARNTRDSGVLVAAIARKLGVTEVRAITDPLHCVRTVRTFRAAGLPACAEPVYGSPMWRVPWMRRGQLVREAVATAWYRVRYGIR